MNIEQLYFFIFLLALLLIQPVLSSAQRTIGSSGLLNTPSANIFEDKTFSAGVNYLPKGTAGEKFNYNTGNYYLDLVFLPFVEITYRMTLIKSNGKFNQQDRAFGAKWRVWKEQKSIPALVLGMDDIYTHTEGESNQYFASIYLVSTKSFQLQQHCFSLSAGYGLNPRSRNRLDGFFGGISYSPQNIPELKLMAEYDTHHLNLAASVFLWKHLSVYTGWYGINKVAAGLAYRIVL